MLETHRLPESGRFVEADSRGVKPGKGRKDAGFDPKHGDGKLRVSPALSSPSYGSECPKCQRVSCVRHPDRATRPTRRHALPHDIATGLSCGRSCAFTSKTSR